MQIVNKLSSSQADGITRILIDICYASFLDIRNTARRHESNVQGNKLTSLKLSHRWTRLFASVEQGPLVVLKPKCILVDDGRTRTIIVAHNISVQDSNRGLRDSVLYKQGCESLDRYLLI